MRPNTDVLSMSPEENGEVQGHSKEGRDPETSLIFRSEINHRKDGHKNLSLVERS